VNKKPPELPNIEDATLRACLAPLMDAMNAATEAGVMQPLPGPGAGAPRQRRAPSGSNDNPLPVSETTGLVDPEYSGTPKTLAEWRLLADDEFGVFRIIELFLAMTDAELASAVAEFPRQIGGTAARIARIKRRLAAQYDTVTTAAALLDRAMAQAAGEHGGD